jgi:hypothetical protein
MTSLGILIIVAIVALITGIIATELYRASKSSKQNYTDLATFLKSNGFHEAEVKNRIVVFTHHKLNLTAHVHKHGYIKQLGDREINSIDLHPVISWILVKDPDFNFKKLDLAWPVMKEAL